MVTRRLERIDDGESKGTIVSIPSLSMSIPVSPTNGVQHGLWATLSSTYWTDPRQV